MQIFPGIDPHFLTLVLHLKLPIIREIIMMHGMLDCSRETCKRILTGCAAAAGRSVGAVPSSVHMQFRRGSAAQKSAHNLCLPSPFAAHSSNKFGTSSFAIYEGLHCKNRVLTRHTAAAARP